jgi:hypothetical protein
MSSFFLDQATSKRYLIGIPFGYGDMNYTAAGATEQTFHELGFVRVDVQPRPDDRYYINNSNPKDDGSWDSQPRDLDELKADEVSQLKTTTGSLLAGSDWMVVRKMETGQDIPAEWIAYRAAVRAHSNEVEARIKAITAIEDLIVLDRGEWPTTPEATNEIQRKPNEESA